MKLQHNAVAPGAERPAGHMFSRLGTPHQQHRVTQAAAHSRPAPAAPLLAQSQTSLVSRDSGVPPVMFANQPCSCSSSGHTLQPCDGLDTPPQVFQQQQQRQAWPQQQLASQQQQQQATQQQRRSQTLRLLSDGQDKSSGAKPEPPAASGAPPPNTAGSGSSSGGSGSSDTSSKPVATNDGSVEDQVDAALEKVWANLKQDLKKELPPDQASMLDKWTPSDIQSDKVFREMANHQLGPFLQSMGIDEDPFEFFLDLFRLSLVFQLGAAALVFYTVELGLGGNAGDAFRAVGGLFLGYMLRLGIKVEQLAWPIYNGLVQLLISEGATYEIPPASAQEQRETLNKLGVTLAVAFLVPKFVFGWQNDECWQIVVPMLGGLFFFDVAYMFGLLIKIGMSGGDGDDSSKS